MNPNAWPAGHDDLCTTSAGACLVQELRRATRLQVIRAERQAARSKWCLAATAAVLTDANRNSAGTAIAVRWHHGLAVASLDDLPRQHRARFSTRWWGAYARGGVHLATVYPWDSEGPTERNLALLQYAACKLSLLKGPWVLGGDFKMTPAVLGATGWLGLVRGVVVAPQAATCGSRYLDYFVVSESFAHAVAGVAVVSDAAFKPHSLVRLFLKPRPRSLFVRRVISPCTLGAVYPAGPVNQ